MLSSQKSDIELEDEVCILIIHLIQSFPLHFLLNLYTFRIYNYNVQK